MKQVASELLDEHLPQDRRAHWDTAKKRAETEGVAYLDVFLASIPRKIGREHVNGGTVQLAEGTAAASRVVVGSLRLCDLAAAVLFERTRAATDSDVLLRLYFQGDAEERRMILSALSFLPTSKATTRLLQEAHRTNDGTIFAAAFADTDLPARILDDDDYARAVLKCAFIDLPLDRLLEASSRATPTLSRMLLDFMSEREAAHRPVWAGSLPLAAHAPVRGVLAKIIGDFFSGVDARRLAAATAAATIASPELVPYLADRLEIESYPPVRAALTRALSRCGRA